MGMPLRRLMHAADELHACYSCLSHAQIFAKDRLRAHAQKFVTLSVALESRAAPPLWRIKPKLHLWQHLCELADSLPAESWAYRDEDFGGLLARLSRGAGGARSPQAAGKRVLLKFVIQNAVPKFSA